MKFKLCIVTSVYNLRKTRELNYYLKPTLDLIDDLKNSNIDLFVFTDQDIEKFPVFNNVKIINTQADCFIKEFWNDVDWKKKYSLGVNNDRHREQVSVPELVSIWLGKFSMLKIASNFSKANFFLWQDSGIHWFRVPFELRRSSHYKRKKIHPHNYNSFVQKNIDNHLILMKYGEDFSYNFHGVDMRKYFCENEKIDLIMAGLMFLNRSEINNLFESVKNNWSILVENNDMGTEENALTLYKRNRLDIKTFCYPDFLELLMNSKKIIHKKFI